MARAAELEGISNGGGRPASLGETGYGRNNGRVWILDLACGSPRSRGWCSPSGRTGVLANQRRLAGHRAVEEDARGRDATRALIAVGSRGLTRRLRLGSVSTKMLRAAGGPILVYTQAEI